MPMTSFVNHEENETRRCPNKSEIITTVIANVEIINCNNLDGSIYLFVVNAHR